MLKYYSKRSHGEEFTYVEKPSHHEGIWYHAPSVTSDDIDELTKNVALDKNILRDVLDEHELPRVEYDDDDNIYLFLRSAWINKGHVIKTAPFLAVSSKTSFVTLSKADVFNPQIVSSKKLRVRTSDTMTLLLLTVASTISEYETLIGRTTTFISNIKGRLRSRMATNEDFIRFISIEDNLNLYGYNLEATKDAISLLRTSESLTARDKEAIDDIILHCKQLLASVRAGQRSVQSIQSAHATISNNVLNQRMKVLTVAALLITIPNAIYGMYGMNIVLPIQDQPWAYWYIMGSTAAVVLIALIVAKRYRLF